MDRTEVTNAQFATVRRGDRLRHRRRAQRPTPRTSRRAAREARRRLARLHAARGPGPAGRSLPLVALRPRARLAASRGAGQRHRRARRTTRSSTSARTTPSPTRSGPANGCRPRRSGSSPPAAGSTASPTSGATSSSPAASGWPTSGRASSPSRTRARTASPRTAPVGALPAQRLRPLRHGRQRLGVVLRLVPARLLRRQRRAAARTRRAPRTASTPTSPACPSASSAAARSSAATSTARATCPAGAARARGQRDQPPRITAGQELTGRVLAELLRRLGLLERPARGGGPGWMPISSTVRQTRVRLRSWPSILPSGRPEDGRGGLYLAVRSGNRTCPTSPTRRFCADRRRLHSRLPASWMTPDPSPRADGTAESSPRGARSTRRTEWEIFVAACCRNLLHARPEPTPTPRGGSCLNCDARESKCLLSPGTLRSGQSRTAGECAVQSHWGVATLVAAAVAFVPDARAGGDNEDGETTAGTNETCAATMIREDSRTTGTGRSSSTRTPTARTSSSTARASVRGTAR